MSQTHSHTPRRFSFHNVTFPSPQPTASIFPARLHDTRHTTSGNLPAVIVLGVPDAVDRSRADFTHGDVGESFDQHRLRTENSGQVVLSTDLGCCRNRRPILDAQA